MKAVNVFAGSIASNTCCAACLPIPRAATARGSRRRLVAVELPDEIQHGVERARRRQAVDGDPESGLAARALLVADVHVRGRVVTHQHDVQSGRPPGLTPKRVDLWC
jgi:hypothetical protein